MSSSAHKAVDLSQIDLASSKLTLNDYFEIKGFLSVKDNSAAAPPAYLPADVEAAFREGAACLSIECYNAAATMFRLCIDLATRPLLPDPSDTSKPQPNSRARRDLGLRLQWLFDYGLIPEALRELAKAIREDANDGAHAGLLQKADAEDVLDFTDALLDRLISEPERLRQAEERRNLRRSSGHPT